VSLAGYYQSCRFKKGTPRVAEKLVRDRAEDAALTACYAKVDRRDDKRCTFPGCRRRMQHHHHIVYRSHATRGEKHLTRNVTSTCETHHGWVHGGLVTVEGNADKVDGLRWQLTETGRAAKIRIPNIQR